MSDDDLELFRKQWLSEINDTSCSKRKRKSSYSSKPQSGCSTRVDDESPEIKQKRRELQRKESSDEHLEREIERGKIQKLGAFEIANQYLSASNVHCKYCINETESKYWQSESKSSKHPKCRKCNFDEKYKNTVEEYTKEKENLLDVLISDLDEITSIPFFDLELPKEIAINIFRYLSIKDLQSCALVNSRWKTLSEDDLIWYSQCFRLDIHPNVVSVYEKGGWKQYVKKCMKERFYKQRKWKERLCNVIDLEYEKGGILCAANIADYHAVAAYIDGSIRLWELRTGSYGIENLKEKFDDDEEIILSMCTCLEMSNGLCVGGFKNGDVMVWNVDTNNLTNRLVFMGNFDSLNIQSFHMVHDVICIQFPSKYIILQRSEEDNENGWQWRITHEKSFSEKICHLKLFDSDINKDVFIAAALRNQLELTSINRYDTTVILDTLAGASFSCIDYKRNYIVAAVGSFGYSVLDGYRIRKYSVSTTKQVASITGSQTTVNCMDYAGCHGDFVLIGCSDLTIRIHDFNALISLVKIHGAPSMITTLQMDKWKVVSGHVDGTICLWDSKSGVKYWQTYMKHPVRICHFNESLLTYINIPEDTSPQNSCWNADDLIQHRKYRGSIRVMDFSKDTVNAIPEEFQADYDNITGYDYNIDLIAPYDDVEALNLPKIYNLASAPWRNS